MSQSVLDVLDVQDVLDVKDVLDVQDVQDFQDVQDVQDGSGNSFLILETVSKSRKWFPHFWEMEGVG